MSKAIGGSFVEVDDRIGAALIGPWAGGAFLVKSLNFPNDFYPTILRTSL